MFGLGAWELYNVILLVCFSKAKQENKRETDREKHKQWFNGDNKNIVYLLIISIINSVLFVNITRKSQIGNANCMPHQTNENEKR